MTRFPTLTWTLLQDHMRLDMASAILAIYLTSSYFHNFHLVHPGTDCPSEYIWVPDRLSELAPLKPKQVVLLQRTHRPPKEDGPNQPLRFALAGQNPLQKVQPRNAKMYQGSTKMYQLQHISRDSKTSSMLWAEALDSLEVCGLCTIQALPWVLTPDQSWGHMKKNVPFSPCWSLLMWVISLNLYVEGQSPCHDLAPCSVLGQALKLPHIGCRKQSRWRTQHSTLLSGLAA